MLSPEATVRFILLLLSLAVFLPLSAQDDLSALKAQWNAQKYQQVLLPLLDYRDALGGDGSFEVDFMIGTAMCRVPQFKNDGRVYLETLRQAYGNNARFEGRTVSQSIPLFCGVSNSGGCAETEGKADNANNASDCAGVDGKADSPNGGKAGPTKSGTSVPKNAQGIRNDVKNRLTLETDTDRPGQDIRSFDLANPQPELCRAVCLKDPACKAFTYVRPGFQGPKARCWLKSGVPERNANKCCMSGTK